MRGRMGLGTWARVTMLMLMILVDARTG